MNPILKNINPNGLYNSMDIARNGWFYWLKGNPKYTHMTVIRYLLKDLNQGPDGILQPTIRGEGNGRRWYVKGENIIKFINTFEK